GENIAWGFLHCRGSITHGQMAWLTKNRADLVVIVVAELKLVIKVGGGGRLSQQFKGAGLARRTAINAVSGEVMDGLAAERPGGGRKLNFHSLFGDHAFDAFHRLRDVVDRHVNEVGRIAFERPVPES